MFLGDRNEFELRGHSKADGYLRIRFGECVMRVLVAHDHGCEGSSRVL